MKRGTGGCTRYDFWCYNWCPGYLGILDRYPGWTPMIRDMDQLARLDEAVEIARGGGGWLMGFNEPNVREPYGSLIPPAEAAVAWRAIEQKADGIKLLSPAPSQLDPGWLWRMVSEYEQRYGHKPRFDAIGVHCYCYLRNPPDPQEIKDHLLRVRREALAHGYDVPLWLTEFAGACNLPNPQSGNEQVVRELLPWLEATPWIGRYSWFMSYISGTDPWAPGMGSCSLTDSSGDLTGLGELYTK
ncbi:MAG: glycosyl hydrolase [Chloroflexota bacterium]